MKDGTCVNCPPFTKLLPSKKDCAADTCNSRQQLTKSGTCAQCEDYFEQDPMDNTKCVMKRCGVRERVTKEATCVPCLEFERAQGPDGKSCGRDSCNVR